MKWGTKKVLLGISMAVFIMLAGGGIYKQQSYNKRDKILETPLQALTMEEKIEDFEYLYKTIEENYPYLEVNKRMNGVDWLNNKERYLQQVKESRNDKEFAQVISDSLDDLHNGHTQLLSKEEVEWMREVYHNMKVEGYWQGINYDTVNKPLALRRYNIPLAEKEEQDEEIGQEVQEKIKQSRVIAKDALEGRVGYIHIPQMLNPWNAKADYEIIQAYLQNIKDYQALIIDIRGNGGGDTRYWSDFLLPQIIDKSYVSWEYTFYKDGVYLQRYMQANHMPKMYAKKVKDLDTASLPELPPEVSEDFTYYEKYCVEVKPAEDSIQFQGNIYLLVDHYVYSSAEGLAMFAKSSGLATLIGEKTGGDGIGSDPILAMLPKSGYVVRFTKEMGTSEEGVCNEEHKTIPDHEVEHPMRKDDLSIDTCIQKVLDVEGLE